MIIAFNQVEFDKSSETEVSPKKGCFSRPESFVNQLETYFFSLIFDADDELSSV